MIALGGIMLFFIPCAQDCEARSKHRVTVTTATTTTSNASCDDTVTDSIGNGRANGPSNV